MQPWRSWTLCGRCGRATPGAGRFAFLEQRGRNLGMALPEVGSISSNFKFAVVKLRRPILELLGTSSRALSRVAIWSSMDAIWEVLQHACNMPAICNNMQATCLQHVSDMQQHASNPANSATAALCQDLRQAQAKKKQNSLRMHRLFILNLPFHVSYYS